jgi:hypothetical protein
VNPARAGAFTRSMSAPILSAALLLPLLGLAPPQDEGSPPQARAELEQAFEAQGIRMSLEGRWCSIPARICIREDLLEYVLVAPFGAAHESLFSTEVVPSLFATALVTLGATPGSNAAWVEKDPLPSDEALAQGASPYDVTPPTGTGFYLYATWTEEGERYFFRVEDLISNLRTGRSMRRHEWVYLGSRLVRPDEKETREVLAADLEGNLINLSYFRAGNTLFTAALDDCVYQTIWLPNAFLVPPRDTPVTLVFSRERLATLPEALADRPVPAVREPGDDSGGER